MSEVWAMHKYILCSVSPGWNQGVSQPGLWSHLRPTVLFQVHVVVGRIQFLLAVWPKSLFSCWLFARDLSQLLEATLKSLPHGLNLTICQFSLSSSQQECPSDTSFKWRFFKWLIWLDQVIQDNLLFDQLKVDWLLICLWEWYTIIFHWFCYT